MDHTEAKQRIAELTEQLNRYNYEYYMNDTSLISDFEFDKLLEELMRLDWLCDNIEGSIPAFDEVLPRSQELVRLLGLHRDTIPPKTEEAEK